MTSIWYTQRNCNAYTWGTIRIKNYYSKVYVHETTNSKWVRLNLSIGLGKQFFSGNIFLNSMRSITGEIYASILIISSRILRAQPTYTASLLAVARCLLLCVAAILEAICQLLSSLYYFNILDVALHLCNKYLYLFRKHMLSDLSTSRHSP